MNTNTASLARVAALAASLFALPVFVRADEPAKKTTPELKLPAPGEVKELHIHPAKARPDSVLILRGSDESAQLLVTGVLNDGSLQDLTGDVKYLLPDPKVVNVTPSGRVIPLANGDTDVLATYGDKAVRISVRIESQDIDLPINFANHITPIFTKLGCNSGGCHGKSGGQNGFGLSLLGFVP